MRCLTAAASLASKWAEGSVRFCCYVAVCIICLCCCSKILCCWFQGPQPAQAFLCVSCRLIGLAWWCAVWHLSRLVAICSSILLERVMIMMMFGCA